MRVFVTGASGFIGSATVRELIGGGHEVVGLARTDESAAALEASGAEVLRGSLEDLDSLGKGAAAADGVIHTAYIHDFSRMQEAAEADLRAVKTLAAVLEGSERPLVVTSGIAASSPGRAATEDDSPDPAVHPRFATEGFALGLASSGVRSSVIRPGRSVHGEGDHGFVPFLIGIAQEKGVCGYVGDGSSRWPVVHRLDTARLYRVALERAPAESVLHAVAENVPTRDIAEAIGRQLDLPVVSISADDAPDHFGWMAAFWGVDASASSALTQERFGWKPTEVGLIADLEQGHYFEQVRQAA